VKKKQDNRPKLRLIQGGNRCEALIGSVKIVASTKNRPPFKVDAIAAEEDTYLVLSEDLEIHEPTDHPIRLLTEVLETRPETPGTVLVKDKYPYKLLAIVHDLGQDPSWKEKWVVSALQGIFHETEKRKVRSLALPMLGTLHGSLDKKCFVAFLKKALHQAAPRYLKCLWLIVPADFKREIIQLLENVKMRP
jgi:hypothetical protein|tara:strand:+ start:1992 stop:2567 length:576 start_codon:yes stop_codon:yes gene_type:complete